MGIHGEKCNFLTFTKWVTLQQSHTAIFFVRTFISIPEPDNLAQRAIISRWDNCGGTSGGREHSLHHSEITLICAPLYIVWLHNRPSLFRSFWDIQLRTNTKTLAIQSWCLCVYISWYSPNSISMLYSWWSVPSDNFPIMRRNPNWAVIIYP